MDGQPRRHLAALATIMGLGGVPACNVVLGLGDFRPGVCDEGATQCAGSTPQTCAAGQWNSLAPCPVRCSEGACTGPCTPGDKRCGSGGPETCDAWQWVSEAPCDAGRHCQGGYCVLDCAQGATECVAFVLRTCIAGLWQDTPCSHSTCLAGVCQGACAQLESRCQGNTPQSCDVTGQWVSWPDCAPPAACVGGSCVGPSCEGLPETCGPGGDESCCLSPVVLGGTYDRSNDPSAPATVSDFRLDRFEITVGRFRKFTSAVVGGWRPAPGSGKHTHLAGGAGLNGGTEPGWDASWSTALPSSDAAWDADLNVVLFSSASPMWTPSVGANETRPINGLGWYEAYAFCIWDGGFLPSEAEWNYAAAGGALQRDYPWGSTDDPAYAVGGGGDPANVGSTSPQGDGLWGQADLAGNVLEATLDYYEPYPVPCSDCAVLVPGMMSDPRRVFRGGNSDGLKAPVTYRWDKLPEEPINKGARCARAP